VIVTTDYTYIDSANPQYNIIQNERRIITAVSGNTVSFDQPLDFMHYGKIYTPACTISALSLHSLICPLS